MRCSADLRAWLYASGKQALKPASVYCICVLHPCTASVYCRYAGLHEQLGWRMVSKPGGATVKPDDYYRLAALHSQVNAASIRCECLWATMFGDVPSSQNETRCNVSCLWRTGATPIISRHCSLKSTDMLACMSLHIINAHALLAPLRYTFCSGDTILCMHMLNHAIHGCAFPMLTQPSNACTACVLHGPCRRCMATTALSVPCGLSGEGWTLRAGHGETWCVGLCVARVSKQCQQAVS